MEQTTPTNLPNEQLERERLEAKIDAIYISVEKTRKYFLYTLIATAVTVLLPVLALLFVLPTFIDTLTSATELQLLEGL